MPNPKILATFMSALAASAAYADGGEWPQWRGPTRDCFVAPTSAAWPDSLDSLNRVWRVELGPGYSGPIVWGDKVFVTETRDEKYEIVRALDRNTGRELWKSQWEGAMSVPFFAKSNGDWIRSTPACDGRFLYVGGMQDVLVCIDIEDGAIRWRVDFAGRYETGDPAFGFVCSPLLDGDALYVQVAASVVRVDRKTGDVVWRSMVTKGEMTDSAFSSPVIATLQGKRQLVVQTRMQLAGLEPATGDILWAIDVPNFRGMNILTPTVIGDQVLTSTYKNQTYMYAIEKGEDGLAVREKWRLPAQGYMSSPVVVNGFGYLHLGNGRLCCIDLDKGEQRWRTKSFGKYWSMAVNRDRILALDQRGGLVLLAANPDKPTILARKRIADDETWAHLAVAGEQLFIRELRAISCYRWKSEASSN